MKIIKYPDNSSYVEVPSYSVQNEFVFKINSYEDLWHLNQLVDAWNYRYNKKPTIIIPNLIDAQADRRFNNNQSNGLKLVCQFLNNMNADFKIFHPHNPEVIEALMNNVEIIDNKKFIQRVLRDIIKIDYFNNKKKIIHKDISDHLTLMSSDAGGFKSLMKLCDKIEWKGETYSANKYRHWNGTKSELTQNIHSLDFNGKNILIIDDICVYGGTFKGLSNILKERNIGKLYLAVSHMTVKNLGKDSVTNYFDKVFITNSKYDYYYGNNVMKQPKNLEIIKMF